MNSEMRIRRPSTRLSSKLTKNLRSICSDDDDDELVSTLQKPRIVKSAPRQTNSTLETEFKKPQNSPPHTPMKKKSNERDHHPSVTPPKQRRTENDENKPKTPRTPTVLLQRLSLASPGEKGGCKQLFQETDLYQSARRALHSACPTSMPGRERELSELREFISIHLEDETSGALYISGPPGTGKTATLNLLLEDSSILAKINRVYVNCTSIKSSGAIFSRITKELGIKCGGKTEKDYTSAVEMFLRKAHKTVLLVLDEIDQLESRRQSVLYTIFEWPSVFNSKLILIGIANALDLTDRILPRLQSRCELKPQLMHFAPYSKQQIVEIFTSRLRNAGVLDIFSPTALQLLAGKVASISGDVRRALDIGRRVVELVDRKTDGDNLLKAVENFTDDLNKSTGKKEEKIESVSLREVMTVLNNVYTTNFDNDVDDAFPLQQKIIVCSLLLILRKANNKDVTIGRLHDVYRRVCNKRNIQAVDQGEFVGLCSLIETRGMIRVIKKKDTRMHKIALVWDEEEVGAALKDKVLLGMILQDDGCLGKL